MFFWSNAVRYETDLQQLWFAERDQALPRLQDRSSPRQGVAMFIKKSERGPPDAYAAFESVLHRQSVCQFGMGLNFIMSHSFR